MKTLLSFLLLFSFLQAEDDTFKVVYDLTTKNIKTFEKKVIKGIVANKTYYENNFKELEVAVIIHGGAYKFFINNIKKSPFKNHKQLLKSYSQLKKRVASLAQTYDVKFYICKVGLQTHHINENNLAKFVQIIPNASIGLINKQHEGFAYIPVAD